MDLEALFKMKIAPTNNHISLYLGMRHGMDGWRWLLGFKVAGIKVKFPIHLVLPANSITTEQYLDWKEELRASGWVLGCFLVGSYAVHRWSTWKEEKRIQKWKANNLATMRAKITETLLLIKNKAE